LSDSGMFCNIEEFMRKMFIIYIGFFVLISHSIDTFGKDSKFTMTGGTATFNGDVTCFSDEKSGKIAL